MKVILFPLLSLLLVTTGKVSRYRCIQRVIRIIEKPLLENLGEIAGTEYDRRHKSLS